MKLRLRSLETKQTHKIQIPDSSTLRDLKLTLIQTLIPNSNRNQNPCSSIDNLRLSLNRKDEIQSNEGSINTLQSLGITNGDLIFFTLNPRGFNSTQDSIFTQSGIQSALVMEMGARNTPESSIFNQIRDAQKGEIEEKGTQIAPESCISAQIRDAKERESVEKGTQIAPESSKSAQIGDAQKEEIVETDQNLVVEEDDCMEVDEDGEGSDGVDGGSVAKSFSVPGFLRKVFTEELRNDCGRDHKLLVIAIHAVLLDSGLVLYDAVGRKEINGFPEWPLNLFNLRLLYTLPGIMNLSSDSAVSVESVSLKFHSLGNFVTVYGSLVNGNKSAVCSVSFDEGKLVPFLNVVWANCGLNEEISFDGHGSGTNAEKEVFEFWRRVKDELALPMLIDLSEKYGFLPACFMRLPTEIKLKILELLPGVDVARVGCACSELRYLSSSDELWKKKFAEQFGDAAKAGDEGHWKSKFVRYWETNRKRRRVVGRYSLRMPPPRRIPPRPWMPPIVGGLHDIGPNIHIIGGDYDVVPGLPPGGVLPIGRHHQSSHVPHCDLGGSGPPLMPPIVGGFHDSGPNFDIIGGHYDIVPGLPPGGVLPIGRHHQSSQVPRCNLGGSGPS